MPFRPASPPNRGSTKDPISMTRRGSLARVLLCCLALLAGPAASAAQKAAEQDYDLLVFGAPNPLVDIDYSRWLDRNLIPGMLSVPGAISAQRFVLSDVAFSQRANPASAPKAEKYLVIIAFK